MEDNQTTWHLLDWLIGGVAAIMTIFAGHTHQRQNLLEKKHDELKDFIQDKQEKCVMKDDFIRALDSMDKNFELINKKLDLLFVPRSDKN